MPLGAIHFQENTMTNPKQNPAPTSEQINPGKKGETHHESGSRQTNPDTAAGKTKTVDNQN